MDDKRQSIYNQVSQHVDVGTFDDFNKAMDDPGRRQKFFKGVSAHVDLGDSNKFYNAVSPQSKIVTDTSKNTSNTSNLSGVNFNQGGNSVFDDTQKTLPSISNYLGDTKPQVTPDVNNYVYPEQEVKARPPLHPFAEMQKPIERTKTPEFVQRMKDVDNPALKINNPDGSYSTHKMTSFEQDGKYYAAPTIVNINGKLKQLSDKDAITYAMKNKEYAQFDDKKDSEKYANGSWKNGDMANAKYPKYQSQSEDTQDKSRAANYFNQKQPKSDAESLGSLQSEVSQTDPLLKFADDVLSGKVNLGFNAPLAVGRGIEEGLGSAANKYGEAIKTAKTGETRNLPLAIMQALNAGVGGGFSAMTAFSPELQAFTAGSGLAENIAPKAAKVAMQPLQTFINPTSEIGKEATQAGDTIWNLVLAHYGGKLGGEIMKRYNGNPPPEIIQEAQKTQSSATNTNIPDIQPESKGNVQPIETKPTDTQPVKVSADPQSRLIVNDLEKYVNGAIKRKSQINEASITNRIDDIRDPVEQKRLGELYNKVLEHNKNLKSGKPIENTENQQAGQTLPVNNPEILPEPKLQPQEIAKNKTNRIIQELLDKEKNQGNQEGQKIVSTAVQTPKDIKAENNFKAHDELDKNATEDQKGFIDNKGNFLNREEAAKIAEDAGQVDKSVKELHSQDLRDGAKNAQTEPIDEVKKGQDNTKTDLTKEAIQKVGGNENFQKGAQEYINQNKNRKSLPEDENLANAYLVEEYRNRVVNEDPKVMDLHKDIPLNPENENQGNPLKQGSNITPEKPVNVEEKQPKPVEDHLIESPRSELPKPISDKILDKTQSMISEIKDAKVENQKAYVSDFEGKKTGNSYINNFPKWFSDLGKSKSEIIKGLQKIIDDQGKDKGKLVEDLKSVILDKLKGEYEESMLTGSAGKFSRENLGKEPADSEILDFINNTKDNLTSDQLHEAYNQFENESKFPFGENEPLKLTEEEPTIAKPKKAPQESLFKGEDNKPVFRTDKGTKEGVGKGTEGSPLFEQPKEDKGQTSLISEEKPDLKRLQDLQGSIKEGEGYLKGGKDVSGEKLTPDKRTQIEKSVESSKQKYNDEIAKNPETAKQLGHEPIVKETPEGLTKESPKRIISQESYDQAKKNIVSKGQNLTSGIDPTLLKDYATVGSYHFENGLRKFSDWSKKMIDEFGDSVKEHLQKIWDGVADKLKIDMNQNRYGGKDRITVNDDGTLTFNQFNDITKREWSKVASLMKKEGYDYRNGDDAKMMTVRQLNRGDGQTLKNKDLVNAFREATNYNLSADESKQQDIIKQAKKDFGVTGRFKEGGYLTPDGKLLDFSGKSEGGTPNSRTFDHRQINQSFPDNEGGMYEFMDMGNIRMLPESGGFDLRKEPTAQQKSILTKYMEYQNDFEKNPPIAEAYDNGRTFYKEYDEGTKPSRVINDISKFYEEGKKRVVSEDAYNEAKKAINTLLPRTNDIGGALAQSAEFMKNISIVGAYHVENGIRDFGEWSKKMVEDFKEYGEYIKPHLQEIWDKVKPEEKTQGDKQFFAAKNEDVNRRRADRGLDPIEKSAIRHDDKVFSDAKKAVDEGEIDPRSLARTVANGGHALTDKQTAALDYDGIRIHRELSDTQKQLDSMKEGDDNYTAVKGKELELRDLQNLNDKALDVGGGETARGLRIRQATADENMNVVKVLRDARKANPDNPLTIKENKFFEDKINEFNKVKKELDDKLEKLEKDNKSLEENNRKLRESQIEKKINREAEFSKRRTGRKEDKTVIQKNIVDLKEQLRKNAIKRANMVSSTPFLMAAEDVPIIGKMAIEYAKSGLLTIEDWTDAIHNDLKDVLEGIDKRSIRDAISGYGKIAQMSKDELNVSIRNQKRIGRLLSAIEDAERKLKPLKSGLQRDVPIKRVQDLTKQLNALLKEEKIKLPTSEKTKSLNIDKYNDDPEGVVGKVKKLEQQLKDLQDGKEKAEPKQKRELTDRESELKQQIKDAKDQSGITQAEKIKSFKTRLENSIKDSETKLRTGQYDNAPKKKIIDSLDKEKNKDIFELQAKKEKLRQDVQDKIRQRELANRPGWEKKLNWGVKLYRQALLSGLSTIEKLTGYGVAKTFAFQPLEDVVAEILGQTPGMSTIIRKGDVESPLGDKGVIGLYKGISAVGRIYLKSGLRFLQGWRENFSEEGLQQIKTGKSKLDYAYGNADKFTPESIEFFGHLHGWIKEPIKKALFVRSEERRMILGYKQGIDLTDPTTLYNLQKDAYHDAIRGILLHDNKANDTHSQFLGVLDRKGTGGKIVKAGLQIEFPIAKVPTNFVIDAAGYLPVGGSLKASYTILKKGFKGEAERTTLHNMGDFFQIAADNMTPQEADAVSRLIKKNVVGTGLFLGLLATGSILQKKGLIEVGGYYIPGEKRKKGDVKAGKLRIAGWDIPSPLAHLPPLEVLQFATTWINAVNGAREKNGQEPLNLTDELMIGAGEAGLGMLSEVPFVSGISDEVRNWFSTTKTIPEKVAGEISEKVSGLIQPDVKKAAYGTDVKEDESGLKGTEKYYVPTQDAPETIERKPEGGFFNQVWQGIELNMPGTRQNVSEKEVKQTEIEKAGLSDSEEIQNIQRQEKEVSKIEKEVLQGKADQSEYQRAHNELQQLKGRSRDWQQLQHFMNRGKQETNQKLGRGKLKRGQSLE